jgi:hypothetical protein
VFEVDVMVGARKTGNGQNMEINKKRTLVEMYPNRKSDRPCINIMYF